MEKHFPYKEFLKQGVLRRYKAARMQNGLSPVDYYKLTMARERKLRAYPELVAAGVTHWARLGRLPITSYLNFVPNHKNYININNASVPFDIIMTALTDCFHSECLELLLQASEKFEPRDDTCPTDVEDEEDKRCRRRQLAAGPQRRRPANERPIYILPREEWHVTMSPSTFLVRRRMRLSDP